VPHLCEVYPGICLTTEVKAQKNLSQGSRRMPGGTMKTKYTEQSIQTIRIHNFNLEKVSQKFKQKVETLMASYKEGNENIEKKAKQLMIAFFHKIFCLYLCHPLSLHQCDKFPSDH
jgi:hypothetical protein